MYINEIFVSVDGEVNKWGPGTPSTFIRLAGCNLRCSFCDTKYAQNLSQGDFMTTEQIIDKVEDIGCKKITITGGEPLLQRGDLFSLINSLIIRGYKVSVETNGSYPILKVPSCDNLSWVVDYKFDLSEEVLKTTETYLYLLTKNDWVKFVVFDDRELYEAFSIATRLKTGARQCLARFAVSPVMGYPDSITAREIVYIIVKERRFDFTLNLQIHKLMNLDEKALKNGFS